MVSSSKFLIQKVIAKMKQRVLYCASVIFRSKIHLAGYWIYFFPVSILSCKRLLHVAHVALYAYCELQFYLVFRTSPSDDFGLLSCSQFISPWDIDNQVTFAVFANSFTGCCGHHYSLQITLRLELNCLALIAIWRFSLGLLFFCAQYRL